MSAAFGPTQALWLLQFELIYLRLFRSISALGPGTEARVCPDWQVSVLQEPLCVRHKLQSSLSFKSQMCYLHAVHLALLDFFCANRNGTQNRLFLALRQVCFLSTVQHPFKQQWNKEQRESTCFLVHYRSNLFSLCGPADASITNMKPSG